MSSLNINKVVLGGRITADLETKQTTQGVAVLSFTIAINRKASRNAEQQTDFIKCIAWRQTAEFIGKYFRKGSSICITGSIQTRTWKDQNGQNQYATEVVVDEAMFVDSKNESISPEASPTPITPNFEEMSPEDDFPF